MTFEEELRIARKEGFLQGITEVVKSHINFFVRMDALEIISRVDEKFQYVSYEDVEDILFEYPGMTKKIAKEIFQEYLYRRKKQEKREKQNNQE